MDIEFDFTVRYCVLSEFCFVVVVIVEVCISLGVVCMHQGITYKVMLQYIVN